ncbi:isochorismatase family protein [Streptomyces sp. NBC_00316]|uniref:isochorismatase family protein n=1 Tax=Streptomyces sp. NBC_00316 TaxID=2975710 RepID=UPI003FA7CFBE
MNPRSATRLPGSSPPRGPVTWPPGRRVARGPYDHAVFMPRPGAFHRTCPVELLGELGVDTLVFAGGDLPGCLRTSIAEATERDFRVAPARDTVPRAAERRELNFGHVQGVVREGLMNSLISHRRSLPAQGGADKRSRYSGA